MRYESQWNYCITPVDVMFSNAIFLSYWMTKHFPKPNDLIKFRDLEINRYRQYMYTTNIQKCTERDQICEYTRHYMNMNPRSPCLYSGMLKGGAVVLYYVV